MWSLSQEDYFNTVYEDTGLKCKEIWDGDRLVERDCKNIDMAYRVNYDSYGYVVGTGSMLPFIDKGDMLFYREVSDNELLWNGEIYVYQKQENVTVLHRLIAQYIGEDGEKYLIFKGDNNIQSDQPILRSAVKRELVGVCFNGYCK